MSLSAVEQKYHIPRCFLLCTESLPEEKKRQVSLLKFFTPAAKRIKTEEAAADEIEEFEEEMLDSDELLTTAARLARHQQLRRVKVEQLVIGSLTPYDQWFQFMPARNRKHIFSPVIEPEELAVTNKMNALEARLTNIQRNQYYNTRLQADALALHNFNRDRKTLKVDEVEIADFIATPTDVFLSQDVLKS